MRPRVVFGFAPCFPGEGTHVSGELIATGNQKEVRMFESLQDRLGSILNGLTGRGALSEADVSA
ncbi:MAG TPA: signal recognition particle protein, partial [Ensifer sp.]|nr:signal recognition particle protein [Ensifer sp.]